MIEKILLPMLGETMDEATIAAWHKKEGDEVKRGDVCLEITTDKATLEVQAYAAGTIRKITSILSVIQRHNYRYTKIHQVIG